jgi:hypothetical protein
MQNQTINNENDLDVFIKKYDISIPLRLQCRRAGHTEKYSFFQFINQFRKKIINDYPVKLIHADKPDFRIVTKNESIGLEVTESIPEQLARASALLENNFPDGGRLEPEFFGWDAPERTNEEILDILNESNRKLIGQGFSVNSVEAKWMNGKKKCIYYKTEKLNNKDFKKFESNYLLIYDNQTRVCFDQHYFRSYFTVIIEEYYFSKSEFKFDKIFINSGNYFYLFGFKLQPILKIIKKSK